MKAKQALLFGAVAAVAALLGFLIYGKWLAPEEVLPAQAAAPARAAVETLPEFSLMNRDGQLQSIRSWPGKSLIVNFWATWCVPCRREIPLLMELEKTRGPEGFQVVGVAVDFREDVLKYADEMKIDYPLLIGEQDGLDAVNAFGVDTVGLPFTVFTDAKERVVTTHLGELKADHAGVILEAVGRLNRGEIDLAAARIEIARRMEHAH